MAHLDPADPGPASRFPAPAGSARIPPSIPDHEMVCRIGEGSYGEVWLARNAVGTCRAIKVIYRDRFRDGRPYEREFNGIQKYEPLSRSNEGLVDILQIGRNDSAGYFYYVMELADDAGPGMAQAQRAGAEQGSSPAGEPVGNENRDALATVAAHARTPSPTNSITPPLEGPSSSYVPKTLASEIRSRGRLPVEECVTLGLTLNLALGHLHRQGLLHRDVKPSNIIFVNGVPKLADVGLVSDAAGAQSFVGTEGFVPPEGPNSAQGDLYALGKTLYEASMGKDRHEFPEPYTHLGGGGEFKSLMELNEVLLRACARDPKSRYPTAEAMNADLALVNSGQSVRDKNALARRLRSMRRAAIGTVVVLAAAVVPYTVALREAARARRAVADGREKLWGSYLAQAQAGRWSHRMGRRYDGLEALRKAAAIRPSPELRDEAIACLALPDFHSLREWFRPPGSGGLAFDARCERDAIGDPRGTVTVRRVADGLELARLPGPGAPVHELRFSPDGRFVAVSYLLPVRPLLVWDLASSNVVFKPTISSFRVLDFAHGTNLLAVAQEEGPILLCDTRSWQVVKSLPPVPLPYWLAFDPQGLRLAASSDQSTNVAVFDLARAAVSRSLPHAGHTFGLSWHPGGKRLAAGCADGCIYLWDANTGELLSRFARGQSARIQVRFSPHGDLLFSTGWDGYTRLWNAVTGAEICQGALEGYHIWLSEDGDKLGYRRSEKFGLAEVASGNECRPVGWDQPPVDIGRCVFSPDGQVLASAHPDGVRFWDTSTGAPCGFKPAKRAVFLAFHPSGKTLVVGSAAGVESWPIDASRRTVLRQVLVGAAEEVDPQAKFGRHETIGMDAEGQRLLITRDGKAHLLDLRTKQETGVLAADVPLRFGALSGNGRWCAAANEYESVARVLDVQTGRVLLSLAPKDVTSLAFSPDDRWLGVGGAQDYWFFETGSWRCAAKLARERSGNLPGVVTFSPDSRLAAVAYSAQSVGLVEPATGRRVATLEAPEPATIAALAFSPDGRRLAVSRWDKSILVWNLHLLRSELAAMNLDWGSSP